MGYERAFPVGHSRLGFAQNYNYSVAQSASFILNCSAGVTVINSLYKLITIYDRKSLQNIYIELIFAAQKNEVHA